MRLQYDSEVEPYKDTSWIQGKGWGSLKIYTWEVTDGYMGGRQNDGSDFRIHCQLPGLPINRIMLGFFDYGPSAVQSSLTTPRDFNLQYYPNPFNPATTILYHVPRHSSITLKIYSIRGELVRTLAEGEFQAGIYTQFWDSLDDRGMSCASGVYVCLFAADNFVKSDKMIKLK